MTFTAPWSLADVEPAAPAPGYLAMLIGGLRESHGLGDSAIMRYLSSAPGCDEGHVSGRPGSWRS